MRIDFRGAYIRMAEQFLNRAQARAIDQHCDQLVFAFQVAKGYGHWRRAAPGIYSLQIAQRRFRSCSEAP